MCIPTLSNSQKHSVQGVCTLCVCYFQETDLCRRGPVHGGVFIPDTTLQKFTLKSVVDPKDIDTTPTANGFACATSLQALLHSSVRRCLQMLSSPSHLGHLVTSFPHSSALECLLNLSSCYGAVSLQKCIRYSPCPVTFAFCHHILNVI